MTTDMRQTLKPCPFCGGPAHTTPAVVGLAALVMCSDNDCATSHGATLDEAVSRWNRRAALASEPAASERETFQARVQPWMVACFGAEISGDRLERGDRLLEEVMELLQSGGYARERVAALSDYVWGRPAGEPHQEAGGVMVTHAAYCLAHGLDMHAAGEAELARISAPDVIAKIRAKQAAKPTGSALPVARSLSPVQGGVPVAERPPYPEGNIVGPCVCGSWPGGPCLRCEWRPAHHSDAYARGAEDMRANLLSTVRGALLASGLDRHAAIIADDAITSAIRALPLTEGEK